MNSDSYPRLTNSDIQEFIEKIVRNGADGNSVRHFCIEKQPEHATKTNATLVKVVGALVDDCGALRNSALESVEARHCGPVFTAIDSQFGDEALGDVEFWNYLAVRYFWQFVAYRQENAWLQAAGSPPSSDDEQPDTDKAKLGRYLLGKDHYQIPLRMYLRAQAVRDGDSFELTDIEGGSTDFWRSQVLGVRTAQFPPVARTVARLQDHTELNIEEQRPAGRRVNRLRANIDFILHTDDDAAKVLTDLWRVTEEDEERASVKRATKSSRASSAPRTRATPPKRSTAATKIPPTAPKTVAKPAAKKAVTRVTATPATAKKASTATKAAPARKATAVAVSTAKSPAKKSAPATKKGSPVAKAAPVAKSTKPSPVAPVSKKSSILSAFTRSGARKRTTAKPTDRSG